MDSKYASIAEVTDNKRLNIQDSYKRKGNGLNHINEKRLRLTNSSNHIRIPAIDNKEESQANDHETDNKAAVPEDIQEARKRLPVYAVRGRLLEEIRKNHTMILIGETGSGKTTQVPQLIHGARLEGAGCIGITQPRRVAAITIAQRVAAEMKTELGCIVG